MKSSTPPRLPGTTSPALPQILIVDDTPANIDILVGLLKGPYALTVATRGDRALALCAERPPDLVLLDVMMPELDGLEVCRRLRATPATRDLPVLFLTARSSASDIVQGFAAGGTDYITKPFQPDELLARIRTHLLLRSQRLEIAAKAKLLEELIRIVSHDAANHFAVLSMSLELVQADPRHNVEEYLPMMHAAVRNGLELTTMVRELRRAEDKQAPLWGVPLSASVDEALLILAPRLAAKHIEVTVDVPPGDVMAIRTTLVNSVLTNILTNAIKFSAPGGRVHIQGDVHEDWIALTISDTGIGMTPEVLSQVFDLGRSKSRRGTQGEEGSGFGMSLMKRFVTQYGGAVEVESRDQTAHPDTHGTDVRLWFRRAPSAAGVD